MSVRANFPLILASPATRATKSSITATMASFPPSRSYSDRSMSLPPDRSRPRVSSPTVRPLRGMSMEGWRTLFGARKDSPMQLAPGLHRVGSSSLFNSYVIDDGGALTIVDAGLKGHWKELLRELEAMGRSPSDIRGLVLTHGDVD